MNAPRNDPDTLTEECGNTTTPRPSSSSAKKKKKHISMHEGIGAWADCCSCEAEPYWRELAEEMGVDLNEYEEDEFETQDSSQESGCTK